MKIVAFSDTHACHGKVSIPECDTLIFAGDLMTHGFSTYEVKSFAEWWNALPVKNKILVAGNHDILFEKDEALALQFFKDTIYLKDSSVTIDGLKIYGSPWQPEFFNWAFNVPRGESIKKYWDLIPDDVNILVTHGPAYGICDRAHPTNPRYGHLGCEELREALTRVKPALHIFGHIHGGSGI